MSERQNENQQTKDASKEPALPQTGNSVGKAQNTDQKAKHEFNWQQILAWIKAGFNNVFAPLMRITDVGFFTAILVVIGWLQWRVFDQQLEVFRGQLREMRSGSALTQQLIDATRQYADAATNLAQLSREKERPLIVVTRSDVVGPFIIKNGASIKVSFVLNNDGHSATAATIFTKMYVQQRSAADLAVEQRDVCKEALSGKKITIVADGGTGSQEINLSATADEVRKGTETVSVPNISFLGPRTTRESYISPYLRGCVQYTYGTEMRRREFSGIIARTDGMSIDPKGSDIRAADMKVSLMTGFSN